MAHYAKIDENNVVRKVVVVPDEQEHRGQEYLNEIGLDGTWIQTSFNKKTRNTFAAKGRIYDPEKDIFLDPKPYESWILNEDLLWIAPVSEPDYDSETQMIDWDESELSWKITDIAFKTETSEQS